MTDQQEEFCATGAAPYPVILGRLIRVMIDGVALDLTSAQTFATALAQRAASAAMLIA